MLWKIGIRRLGRNDSPNITAHLWYNTSRRSTRMRCPATASGSILGQAAFEAFELMPSRPKPEREEHPALLP